MPRTIAVIGASGFIGDALCTSLRSAGHTVTGVTRADHAAHRDQTYDVVINAAMPSRRYWAKRHPALDFAETVQKTADLLYGWHFGTFIQISSVSARCERDHVYGRHKAAAEALCDRADCLIVRLTAVYGDGMTKGALLDIAAGQPVYVDAESRYAFTPLSFAVDWVAGHLDARGIVEVGARNTISLREIADHAGRSIAFCGPREFQDVEPPDSSFPDAREVLRFVDGLL